MSSPARSSASATSGGQGGGGAGIGSFGDDASPYHFPPDIISVYDRKDEALAGDHPNASLLLLHAVSISHLGL